ncbi:MULTISPECIES: ATP-dependent DNA helicase [Candidatus Ichthyocystis]|uniref:DNA 5'-3' helicase n=1 Tax=Candidatus Ichthyocystis hellenicum TaxID=1561003 RepID=A0A0S4M9D6_9BURK|nr:MULTISPECIES: ATP-dependent DNA helicase [Ichthyocystis]CUT18068.1 putative DEAD box helicase [Candidatus Ichthyocystis hellenicum]
MSDNTNFLDEIFLSIDSLFEDGGQLSSQVERYTPSKSQLEMAKAISSAIVSNSMFVAEAGTGTGKTFAYLAPALLSGRKVIISTGTKALQDQIFYRDLPLIANALNLQIRKALLKGRNNYLCQYHLQNFTEQLWEDETNWSDVEVIRNWSTHTKTGDKTELPDISEENSLWNKVTSTRENCLSKLCPYYSQCHVMAARKSAISADVVVINHHLFFSDLAMRDEKTGSILPHFEVIIFDEAHQIPEISRNFMSIKLSTAKITQTIKDLDTIIRDHAPDSPHLMENIQKLHTKMKLLLKSHENIEHIKQKQSWEKSQSEVVPFLLESYNYLSFFKNILYDHKDRCKELEQAYENLDEFINIYQHFFSEENSEYIRWVEYLHTGFTCICAPLNVGETIQNNIEADDKSWIFCSATLSIDNSFEHFSNLMGFKNKLHEGNSGIWESPFDYENQSMLYVPENFPDPSAPDHTSEIIKLAERLLPYNQGGSFFLFTTHKALQKAAELIKNNCAWKNTPIFVQNDSGKTALLENFRRSKRGVLLGTQTFWEGIDVRGSALSFVLIDKIPFNPPDDPVISAQINSMKSKGEKPFWSFQVPSAALSLKQGAGRLIRDQRDHGVLIITDKRLKTKSYGEKILKSLPKMRVAKTENEITEFLKKIPYIPV